MKSKKQDTRFVTAIVTFLLIILLGLFIKNQAISISGKATKSQDSIKWLLTQQKDNNWNSDIVDTSLALMALEKSNLKNLEEINSAVKWIKNNKNEKQDCFPSYPCRTKDTIFVIYALKLLDNKNSKELIDNALVWLDKLQPTLTSGSYFIKVAADKPETFSCEIILTELNNTIDSFKLDNSTQVLKQIYSSLRDFKINCNTNSTITISLLQQNSDNTYNTIKTLANPATFRLTTGCFSADLSTKSCDADITAYALWLLPELKDKIEISYLDKNRFEFPFRIAVLYSITKDRLYLNELRAMQKDGRWKDVYTTSLISALIDDNDMIDNATVYINSQKNKICWSDPCTVSETAAVILK